MHPLINASQHLQRAGACLLVLVLIAACGPNTRPLRGESGGETSKKAAPRPALEAKQPILRFVPISSELVVVVPNLEQLLDAAYVLAPIAQQVPEAAHWLEALRNTVGAVTESATWTQYGIDPSATLAVFSVGTSTTLLLPMLATTQDGQDLAAALLATQSELLRDDRGAVLALRWTMDPEMAKSQGSDSWVTSMQEAATGLNYAGGGPAAQAAQFAARAVADAEAVWGSVDLGRALSHARLPCAALIAQLDLQVVSLGLKTSRSAADLGVDLHGELQLDEQSTADLRGLLGPSASRGMGNLREQEGLSASLLLDLGAVANALRRQNCRELGDLLAGSLEQLGVAPTSMHFAGSRFDPSELSGRVALQLGLLDKSFFKRLLDGIPGRSLFESRISLGGQKVVKLGVPLMSTLYYQLSDQRLLFSTHHAMMAELLAEPAEDGEILFMQAVPERLPQLTQLLSLAMHRQQAELLSSVLRQFSLLRAELLLKDTRQGSDRLPRLHFHGRVLVPDASR